ncbi:hypothetical protein [Anaerovibrio sp. RM50]|uniref:hypothetical protein n=1 Tax=Anaerovibrio sp. RM50 TaxID=1200557 RepID=UPI000480FB15|nr:hypothetical protein [Anaerovibrio sp. RM50]
MAIISAPDGSYYSDKTGKTYSYDEVKAALDRKQNRESMVDSVINGIQSLWESTKPSAYVPSEKSTEIRDLYLANAKNGTDSEKAARLVEATNILGLDDTQKREIIQSGMADNQILNAAFNVAKTKANSPEDWDTFVEDNPATAKYLTDQKNMAVSLDDINPLAGLENTITSIKDHLELSDLELRSSEIGRDMMHNGLDMTTISADQRVELENINKRKEELSKKYYNPESKWYNPFTWDMASIVGGIAGMKNDFIMGLEGGAAGAAIGGGVGLAAAGVGAIPGAIGGFGKGFTAGMAYSMGTRAMGNQYLESISQKSVDGKYMTADDAYYGALGSGIFNAALGAGGVSRLLSRSPVSGAVIADAFKGAVPDAVLNNPETKQAAWQVFMKNLAASTVEQSAIFGGGTKAIELAARKTSEELSGLEFDHSNEPGAFEQIYSATTEFVPTAVTLSGVTIGGGHIVGSALPKPAESARPKTTTAEALAAIDKAVQDTKTSKRSKESIGTMIDGVVEGSKLETVGIPAKEFVAYFQQIDPENTSRAVEEAKKLGVSEEELQTALQQGQDINVKTSTFVKEYSGTEHINGLAKDVRMGEYTDREIEDTTAYFQELQKQAEEMSRGEGIDKESPVYQKAVDFVRTAYPEASERIIESQANIIHSMFARAEERGILKILGYKDAAEAMEDMVVARKEMYDAQRITEERAAAQTLKQSMDPDKGDMIYIRTREDNLDYGHLGYTENEGALKKAPVRLQMGFHVGDRNSNNGAGAAHIQKHIDFLRNVEGYNSLQEAVSDILNNYSDGVVLSATADKPERVILIKQSNADPRKIVAMTLDYMTNDAVGGDYYSVVSISPRKAKDRNKLIKKGTSFDGRSTPSTDSGIGATGAPVADETSGSPGVLRPSKEGSFGSLSISEARAEINKHIVENPNTGQKLLIENPLLQKGNKVVDINDADPEKIQGAYIPPEQGKAIIELYKNADYSTLSHEMMHHFVNLYKQAIETGKASEEVIRDFEILNKFVGAKDGEAWTAAQHEKITSAYETYLSEGKAPSLELVGVFEKFTNWMKNIYKKMTRQAIPINDDVRGVFDRMLASEEQINAAELFYNSERLFGGKELGLKELHEYTKLLEDAHKEAQRIMNARVMKELSPEFRKMEATARDIATEQEAERLQQEPLYIARMLMSAPMNKKGIKAAVETRRQEILNDVINHLVLNSKLGVEKRGRVVTPEGELTDQFYKGGSLNESWYTEMLATLPGGKLPKKWSEYIDKVKAGDTTAEMPEDMRKAYEQIAKDHLTNGTKSRYFGEIPPDDEFINLSKNTPGIEFILDNGGGLKLDKAKAIEQYGAEAVEAMPKSWFSKDGQWTLDDVADLTGFKSGDELRQAILNSRSYSEELKARVDAKMKEWKDGQLGDIQSEAIKAVTNNKSLEAIGIEAEVLKNAAAELKAKNERETAEAMAEGREKAETQRKAQEHEDKAVEKAKEKQARDTRRQDAEVMQGKLKARAAREVAKNTIGNQRISEAGQWRKMLAAATKAGRQATRAMAKGDYDQAVIFKDEELLQRAMAMEAMRAEKEIQVGMRFFGRINKRGLDEKNIDHRFNVQIDNLMAKYGLLKREPLQPLDGGEPVPLEEFIESCRENYFVPIVPESVVKGEPKHYSRLSLNEFRDLKDGTKSLQHVGRIMDRALADQDKASMLERTSSIIDKVMGHKERYSNQSEAGQEYLTIGERLSRLIDIPIASMVKTETLLRIIDKGEEQGPAVRYIFNPIKNGLDEVQRRNAKAIEDVTKVIKGAGWDRKSIEAMKDQRHHFDFLPNDLTMEEIVLMAMNWGNEGNRDRLRYYFKSPEQRRMKMSDMENMQIDRLAMQVFSVMEEKHWKLVQGVWDYLNTYAPEIRQHEIDCAGLDVKMVEPTPFKVMTKDGVAMDMTGGYYPIAYDPGKSIVTMNQQEANALFKANPTASAMTSHGHTSSRVARVSRPLLLNWSAFTNHIQNVNYDLAMRKPVIDVNKIIKNPDFISAIDSRFGVKTTKALQDWLINIAADQRESLTAVDRGVRELRTRMSVAMLGFRAKALVIDLPQNVITAVWQMGAGNVIKGMTEFYLGNPLEKMDFVNARSTMMREKTSFMDQNMSDFRNNMFEHNTVLGIDKTKLAKAAFCCDMLADMAVNYPMWMHVYTKAIAEGKTDAEASTIADSMIRRSSVDTSKAGLSGIQRGGEGTKLLLPFYSFFNAMFNRVWFDAKLSQIKMEDGRPMDAARLFTRMVFLGLIAPMTVEGIMNYTLSNDRSKDKNKREEKAIKQGVVSALSFPFMMFPIIGGGMTYGLNKMAGTYGSYELSPIESTIEKTFGTPAAWYKFLVEKGGDPDAGRKALTQTADTASLLMGYPMKINTLAINLWDAITKGDITMADFISRRSGNK